MDKDELLAAIEARLDAQTATLEGRMEAHTAAVQASNAEHRKGLEEFIHGYFRKVDARFDDVDRRLDELTTKTAQLDQSIVGLRRDITLLHEIAATQSARMDSMDSRLSRINRRLDLADMTDELRVRVEALEKGAKV
jgi:transposase